MCVADRSFGTVVPGEELIRFTTNRGVGEYSDNGRMDRSECPVFIIPTIQL